MGAGFNPKTRVILCSGQQITNKLDQVFRNPGTPPYQQAQGVSSDFGDIVQNGAVQNNWKDLLIAYLRAGVDVGNEFPAWVEYLEQLGSGAGGPQNIVEIARLRYNSLTGDNGNGIGMATSTGPHGQPVHTNPGSPGHLATIVSPCPVR